MSTLHTRSASWVANADPGGLVYGAIIAAAVLATVSAHAEAYEHVAISAGFVVGTYWMAHVYVDALSHQFRGDTHQFLHRLRAAVSRETGILKGGIPAIVVYVVAALAGADKSSAASFAVYFSVVLLFCAGCLGAHQAGISGKGLVAEGLGAASFGVLIVIAKTFLH